MFSTAEYKLYQTDICPLQKRYSNEKITVQKVRLKKIFSLAQYMLGIASKAERSSNTLTEIPIHSFYFFLPVSS